LPALYAVLTNLRAALYAIQAFAAIGFQTHSNSVISLDLTGIIAFDAVREWEAARRLRCGVPVVGRNGSCIHAREKIQVLPEKQGHL
jgi:general L-amino acid transport system substrate-binding protein